MTRIPTSSAMALAVLVLLLSCITLALGLATPQHHGVLFWVVTIGFGLQALGSAAWLVRLISGQDVDWDEDATNRGTPVRSHD